MSDIRLQWALVVADFVLEDNDLVRDDGLETAVVLSLFTDRRAAASDVLPDDEADRRGWWGDVYPVVPDDRIGSRLWLLSREKSLAQVAVRAREYAQEALQWLVTDRVAARVDITAEIVRPGLLGLEVIVTRPQADPATYRFDFNWTAQAARAGLG